ncbi:MAG: PKD-like domain-containing protein [Bacteroidota bacterium]
MRFGLAAVLLFSLWQVRLSAQAPDIVVNSVTPNRTAYCTGDTIFVNFSTSNFTGSNSFVLFMSKSGFVSDSSSVATVGFTGNQTATISYRFQAQDADVDSAYQLRLRSGSTVSVLFPATPFTVQARPVAVASIPSQTVCSGVFFSAIAFSTLNNVANTTYAWSRNNTTNVSGTASGTGNIAASFLVNNTTTNQTVTYTIIPTGPAPTACAGSAITATIVVKPAPVISIATADTVCTGTRLNLAFTTSIASTTFWYADDNSNTAGEELNPRTANPLRDTITNLTMVDQVVIYNVIATSTGGNCQGPQETVYVTVSPKPTITNDTAAAICSGTLLSIPITSDMAASYTWRAASNGSVTGESTLLQTSDTVRNTLINTTVNQQTVVYTITPTIDSGGCVGTPHILSVRVYPNPTAAFTIGGATVQCERTNSFRFTATTSTAITGYSWTFGSPLSPSGGSGSLLIMNFTGTGDSIPVTLFTTTAIGCADTAVNLITIKSSPAAAFTLSDSTPCSGDTVSFVHSDTSNTGSLIWLWGDGSTNTTCTGCSDAKHRYSSSSFPSTRTMRLVAISATGCRDTSTTLIRVKPNPDANFTVNDNTQCFNSGSHQFILTDKSTVADSVNNPLTYSWDFGDGSPLDTTRDASHTYASIDSYFVYHTLVTSSGCRDSIIKLMVVYLNPQTTITNSGTDTLCGGTSITLTADSGYTYLWSNGRTTRSITVKDTVLSNPYTVVYAVTVTDNQLCSSTADKWITINPVPAAIEISYDTAHSFCAGAKAQLFHIANAGNANYIWTTIPDVIPSGSYSGSQINVDLPGSAGDTFSIYVSASDNITGCSANDTVIIRLSQNQAPTATVVLDLLTLICTNNTVIGYQWGYDDLNLQEHILSGETLQSYYAGADPDVAVSGKYYWVKITDAGGCQSKIYYQWPPKYFTGIASGNSDAMLLRIYPNPMQSLFRIEVKDSNTSKKTIEICNASGQLLMKEFFTNQMLIDASGWNNGMYLLKVVSENGVYKTQRLLKMN